MFSRRRTAPTLVSTLATALTSCAAVAVMATSAHAACIAVPAGDLVSSGHLQLSINPTLPPLQFIDETGKMKGMNVELAEEIGKRLCLKADLLRMDFPAMVPALNAGRFDGINTGMFWTEARSKSMYTVPYAMSTIDVIADPSQKATLTDIKGLAGHSVGVEADSYQEKWLRDRAKEIADAGGKPVEIHAFPTASDMLAALRAGQFDFAALPSYTGASVVKSKRAKLVLGAQGGTPTTMAFRKKSVAEAVAKAMDDMVQDGSYAKLMDSYGMTKINTPHITLVGTGPA